MSKSLSHNEKPAHSANAKMLYLRLLRYAWRYKFVFALGIFSLIVLSATNTGFLATIKQVTDEGFVKQSPEKMRLLPLLLFGLMALRAISGFFSNFSMRWIARRIVEALRRDWHPRRKTLCAA